MTSTLFAHNSVQNLVNGLNNGSLVCRSQLDQIFIQVGSQFAVNGIVHILNIINLARDRSLRKTEKRHKLHEICEKYFLKTYLYGINVDVEVGEVLEDGLETVQAQVKGYGGEEPIQNSRKFSYSVNGQSDFGDLDIVGYKVGRSTGFSQSDGSVLDVYGKGASSVQFLKNESFHSVQGQVFNTAKIVEK